MINKQFVQRQIFLREREGAGRLGRHVLHDLRSHDHPAEKAEKIVSVNHQAQGLPLDQGDLGSCTANALCAALNSDPNRADETALKTEQDAVQLYELETRLEGQPYPPNDPGGSGLMVCRAAKQLGWIKSYRHAFGLDHALRALVLRPVIFGVTWYTTFDHPDSEGIIQLTRDARIRGGHEVCADQIDADRALVGFWNSWGTVYGLQGRFFMPFEVVEQLLQDQGDATVPHL